MANLIYRNSVGQITGSQNTAVDWIEEGDTVEYKEVDPYNLEYQDTQPWKPYRANQD